MRVGQLGRGTADPGRAEEQEGFAVRIGVHVLHRADQVGNDGEGQRPAVRPHAHDLDAGRVQDAEGLRAARPGQRRGVQRAGDAGGQIPAD